MIKTFSHKLVSFFYYLSNHEVPIEIVITYNLYYKFQGKYVIKPDQLIKRRGKLGLVKCGGLSDIEKWYGEKRNSSVKIGKTVGKLRRFIIEPFVEHSSVGSQFEILHNQIPAAATVQFDNRIHQYSNKYSNVFNSIIYIDLDC